ncbi:testis-expressed sequence 9 protein [Platysternon megacephalum]|uniref:Testis-expressed sequence 9 protein n=1 Tax=Platysternon megacephalum TaxID=55544 RepID=A0A4D9E4U8_9SAUR|nr:testis-expressed sequence 9 protein [Platysternon megacephalum]
MVQWMLLTGMPTALLPTAANSPQESFKLTPAVGWEQWKWRLLFLQSWPGDCSRSPLMRVIYRSFKKKKRERETETLQKCLAYKCDYACPSFPLFKEQAGFRCSTPC